MSRLSRPLAVAGAAAVLFALAACSGPSPSATPSGSPSAPATEEGTGSSAAPSTASAGTFDVPLQSTADSGAPRLTVQITVGGGSPVTVMLDTGSTGLYIEQSAVGSAVTATGTTVTQDYVQNSVTAQVSTGVLTIGEGATAAGFAFGVVPDGSGGSSFGGTQGIMGVAPADGDWQSTGMLSPFIQLQAPYDEGFTVDVPASGAGTLTLGRPAAASTAITVPLTPLSPAPSTPVGVGFFEKQVSLCWTIAELAPSCGPTDLDTGSPRTAFNSSVVSGPATGDGGVLQSGQQISLATSSGQPLWSFSTGSTVGSDEAVIEGLGSSTSYNSGIGFFFDYAVGFDWADGQLVLTAR